MNIKFLSRQAEKTSGGTETTVAWNGSKEEMEQQFNSEAINSLSDDGRLRSVRIFQESPNIWCCEKRYSVDIAGTASDKPFTAYGKKSATLKGSMLSMPIESHHQYRACWNYFLAAAPDFNNSLPSWWKTATDTTLTSSTAQHYAWVKTSAEAPSDANGRWHILANPVKPGVETYDIAVYSITETAKFQGANAAGKFVAGCLNMIGSPGTTFGITGGNWKCDDASVFYDGAAWFATLTWTLSGNKEGWDQDLYF